MSLGPKEIHKLKKILTTLDKGVVAATRYCEAGKIDASKIILDGVSAWQRWNNIIDIAIKDPAKTILLLQAVLKENDDNQLLQYFISELTTKNEIRLNTLVQLLKERKCILFIGPDVLQISNKDTNVSFNTYLCDMLEAELRQETVYFDDKLKDKLSYMAQCYTDMPEYFPGDVQRIATEGFDKVLADGSLQEGLLELLAKLPSKLIINANPDILIKKHIESSTGNKCILECYDISNVEIEDEEVEAKKEKQQNVKSIGDNEVLLYNIFGTYSNANSILYTESHFLEFINKVILGNPALNSTVKKELMDQDSYLFIGFDFEQWYFKVLFQLLKLKRQKDKAISCNMNTISILNREFFEEEFKVYFIDADIRLFIKQLSGRIKNNNQ